MVGIDLPMPQNHQNTITNLSIPKQSASSYLVFFGDEKPGLLGILVMRSRINTPWAPSKQSCQWMPQALPFESNLKVFLPEFIRLVWLAYLVVHLVGRVLVGWLPGVLLARLERSDSMVGLRRGLARDFTLMIRKWIFILRLWLLLLLHLCVKIAHVFEFDLKVLPTIRIYH